MNKTILVVDYEQKSLDEIQELFKDEQFDVLIACDGTQALEIFEKRTPDLVMTAALLPKLNGFELCKKIVSGQYGEVRPVIMFSGIYKAEKYRKEAIVGCGAVDFLEKPISKWQLLKVIKGLFNEIPRGPVVGPLQSETPPMRPPGNSTKPSFQSQALASSDDLLEVESLLSPTLQPGHRAKPLNDIEVPVLLGSAQAEPRTVSTNPLDQELDDAVDAVRTDLNLATGSRNRGSAEDVGADFFKEGRNILEFESPVETEPVQTTAMAVEEIIELDAPAALSQTAEQTESVMKAKPESSVGPAAPQFNLGSQQPRNWRPFIAIILVGLLIVLVLWLRS
jgi:two-component system, OmpR family, alkaline phosphatase synthesis response regulator PhoP